MPNSLEGDESKDTTLRRFTAPARKSDKSATHSNIDLANLSVSEIGSELGDAQPASTHAGTLKRRNKKEYQNPAENQR